MNYLSLLLFALGTCLISACAGTARSTNTETQNRWLVVLGTYKDFPEAKRDAEAHAKAGGMPFSMNGRIFDRNGLRLPDDSKDEIYAGEYLLRRSNAVWTGDKELPKHISIEKSEAYAGLESGKYIIVASIAESEDEAARLLKHFKPTAPKAYVKKTPIFLGCMH